MIRLPWQKSNPLVQAKLDMIDKAFAEHSVQSFADLGGVWGVAGGYTFYALDHHPKVRGLLVDTHPTPTVIERAKAYPTLELVAGNFGDPAIAAKVDGVDAVFFFDVLLHQVMPDWDNVLAMYSKARCLIIYNQQWTGPGDVVRLFDLGEDEYFRNVPHKRSHPIYRDLFRNLDQPHPDHNGRLWRDVHHVWQWGISDAALEAKTAALGYRLAFKKNYGRFGRLPQFENHGFVFVR
jgi:hypothetical protein